MSEVQISFATTKHSRQISDLLISNIMQLDYYSSVAKQKEIDKYSVTKLDDKIADDSSSIIIASHEEQIIGTCITSYDVGGLIWADWMVINEDYRGRKISSLLMSALEQSTKLRNCHKIWCDTRTNNQASINLLLKNDYERIATLKNHWYNLDYYLWQKMI